MRLLKRTALAAASLGLFLALPARQPELHRGLCRSIVAVSDGSLLLDHRFGWTSHRDRIGVPMHDLPGTVFPSKYTGRAQRDGRKSFPSGNLRPEPLDFDNVRQLWSDVL